MKTGTDKDFYDRWLINKAEEILAGVIKGR
jgi:hypothetical protein